MKRACAFRALQPLAGLLLLGSVLRAAVEEPHPVRVQFRDFHLGLRVEGEQETDDSSNGISSTYQRYFMGPLLGGKMLGYIYHPNFLQFTLSGEASPGYTHEEQDGPGGFKQDQTVILGDYLFNILLLPEKPYRSNFYLQQSYNYRDYDYFNRVETSTIRYGLETGYSTGPVPVDIRFWQRKEDNYGTLDGASIQETELTFDAKNQRKRGETSFNYTYNNYERTDYGGGTGGGTENSFGLSDSEVFGSKDQANLSLNTTYTKRDYTDSTGDEYNANGLLTIDHTPTLTSYYDANYLHQTTDSAVGTTDSDSLFGGFTLRHQLFKSLTSTLRIQGTHLKDDSSYEQNGQTQNAGMEITRYGAGLTESYTKSLGTIGRLSMLGSLMLEHTTEDSGGDTIIQNDESHTFSSSQAGDFNDSFFLNYPFVEDGSIVITDNQNRTPAYEEGRDYTVMRNGSLTMIQRTGNSTIPVNSEVFVDYRARATGSGDYDTTTTVANIRVDLWENKLSLYARYNSLQNNGSDDLVLQDSETSAIGAETSWKWFRAGVEYEIYDSSLSNYNSVRFFESFFFRPESVSSIYVDFVQSFSDYDTDDRNETNYWFLTRYNRSIGERLTANLNAGLQIRHGDTVDETRASLRPELNFQIGKLTVRLSYTYEYQQYTDSSERQRHLLMLTGQRRF